MFPVCVRFRIGAWLKVVGEQLDVVRAGNQTFGILKRSHAVAAVSLSFGEAWPHWPTIDFQWLKDEVTCFWGFTIKERDGAVNRDRLDRLFSAPSDENQGSYGES